MLNLIKYFMVLNLDALFFGYYADTLVHSKFILRYEIFIFLRVNFPLIPYLDHSTLVPILYQMKHLNH